MPYEYGPSQLPTRSFDFIIVGGGAAGCLLASRLSSNPSTTVLLIERGGVNDNWISHVPLLSANIYRPGAPVSSWAMEPLEHANNRVVKSLIGEGLGGGSRINGCVYTRGIKAEWDHWRDGLGCAGWGWDDVEPFYVKQENCTSATRDDTRGNKGEWMNSGIQEPMFECLRRLRQATSQVGIPFVTNLNSPKSPATCHAVLDLISDDKNYRHSTNRAFLPPSLVNSRKNLVICTNAIVSKILFDGERAVSVQFTPANPSNSDVEKIYEATIKKEVILCAGAVGSPQVLMLSGIGPAEHLKAHGIEVIKDSPGVGSYLKDHSRLPLHFRIPMHDSLQAIRAKPLTALREFLKWFWSGKGWLSVAFAKESLFIDSSALDSNFNVKSDSKGEGRRPDIEIIPVPHRSSEMLDDKYLDPLGIFALSTFVLQPKSHGTVRLASSNPRDRAKVDLKLLSDPNGEDRKCMITGIGLIQRLAGLIKESGYPIERVTEEEAGPGRGVPLPDASTEQLEEYVRANVGSSFHFTSTCRMGPSPQTTESNVGVPPPVVDTFLRVYGTNNVRVADASVFPDIVSTHTMAPATLVAERCADFLTREKA